MRGSRGIAAKGPQTPPPAQGSGASRPGADPTAVGAQRTGGDPPQTPHDAGRITDQSSPLLGNTGSGYNSKRKGKEKARGKARKAGTGKPPPTPAQAAQAREDAERRAARAQEMLSKQIRKRKDRKHAGEAMKEKAFGFLL